MRALLFSSQKHCNWESIATLFTVEISDVQQSRETYLVTRHNLALLATHAHRFGRKRVQELCSVQGEIVCGTHGSLWQQIGLTGCGGVLGLQAHTGAHTNAHLGGSFLC